MSAPIAILNELRARGVELCVEGHRLRFRPVDRVTPELLARLREHKPSLLEFLKADPRHDPGVQAAQREAEHSGVLGKSARDFNGGPQWIEGSELGRLQEQLQGLVMPRPGWTPESWAVYLRRRAELCDERHCDFAELYVQAAQLLKFGNEGNRL